MERRKFSRSNAYDPRCIGDHDADPDADWLWPRAADGRGHCRLSYQPPIEMTQSFVIARPQAEAIQGGWCRPWVAASLRPRNDESGDRTVGIIAAHNNIRRRAGLLRHGK